MNSVAQKPVSNSFDYVPVKRLQGFVHSKTSCTSKALGLSDCGSSRAVIVKNSGQFFLCTTKTTDFSDGEVRYVVHDKGQLYLDRSKKLQIEDLGQDTVQLIVSNECRGCDAFARCCLVYEKANTSFFEMDEAWVYSWLARMHGRVLDVGTGSGYYYRSVADPLRRGEVVVDAIEPEKRCWSRLKEMGINILAERLEDVDLSPASYDFVIAIRSLNHIADVSMALARVISALKRGGTMLLIESLPLPLVRSRKTSQRCHADATGGFQHFHNTDLQEALDILGKERVEPVFVRAISLDTCDQWILVCKKSQ
jgi:ubiquinone/menaquinone biosynthesis C-methylase UbiE